MMFLIPAVAVVLTLLTQATECQEVLIFAEEFDRLDLALWKHELTFGSSSGNFEFQQYWNNRSISYVRDGVLYIKPRLTIDMFPEPNFLESATWDLWGNTVEGTCTGNRNSGCQQTGDEENILYPVQSARMRSGGRFSFRYGRVEVEAQLPKGDWIWPAIWLLPATEHYGAWPTSGEIDIMESRGNVGLEGTPTEELGYNFAAATLHWGPFWETPYANRFDMTTGGLYDDTLADSFHIYEMEWTEFGLIASIDGIPVMSALPPAGGFWEFGGYEESYPGSDNPWQGGDFLAPFDEEFYFILNVAVGGTNGFFPDGVYPNKPWANDSPTPIRDFWEARDEWYPTWNADVNNGEDAAMKINYIRVYQNV